MTPVELPIFLTSSFMAVSQSWQRYTECITPRSRVPVPSPRTSGCLQRLELVDQALDHRQAALPEARVAGVEPERLEQVGMVLGAAGREHHEIACGEARLRALVDRIERIHQAI